MRVTQKVKKILDWYEGDPPGVKANLARILCTGNWAAPARWSSCRSIRASSTDRHAALRRTRRPMTRTTTTSSRSRPGLNAYAAPLGMIAAGRRHLRRADPDHPEVQQFQQPGHQQGPGGHRRREGRAASRLRRHRLHDLSRAANSPSLRWRNCGNSPPRRRRAGLAVVVWSYPRGPNLDRAAETALDICAYAAQMAALMGANIIKVKPPSAVVSLEAAKKSYEKFDGSTLAKRVAHVMQCVVQRQAYRGVLRRRGEGS